MPVSYQSTHAPYLYDNLDKRTHSFANAFSLLNLSPGVGSGIGPKAPVITPTQLSPQGAEIPIIGRLFSPVIDTIRET